MEALKFWWWLGLTRCWLLHRFWKIVLTLFIRLASFCVISTSSSQCTYTSNKTGTEPSRPCRPIDLTPDLYPTFTNRFSVVWGNFGKVWSSGEKYGSPFLSLNQKFIIHISQFWEKSVNYEIKVCSGLVLYVIQWQKLLLSVLHNNAQELCC